jgi:hypothetical protein
MALAILTGSNTTTDISLGGTSVKCGFGRVAAQIVRGAFRTTTFCSGGWVAEIPGERQLVGSLLGYSIVGVAYADPLIWVTDEDGVAMIITAQTGATITFTANVFSDGLDLVAAANSGRNVDFRSTGTVSTVWPVV